MNENSIDNTNRLVNIREKLDYLYYIVNEKKTITKSHNLNGNVNFAHGTRNIIRHVNNTGCKMTFQ